MEEINLNEPTGITQELHNSAMDLMNIGMYLRRTNALEGHISGVFRAAYNVELIAAGQVINKPSEAILLCSAAQLALDAGDFIEAHSFAVYGLRVVNDNQEITANKLRSIKENANLMIEDIYGKV